MDKKTGTIITIVVAVIAVCLSLSCCGSGISWSAGLLGGDPATSLFGLILICPAILVLLVPVALWFFLVRGKEDEGEVAQMDV